MSQDSVRTRTEIKFIAAFTAIADFESPRSLIPAGENRISWQKKLDKKFLTSSKELAACMTEIKDPPSTQYSNLLSISSKWIQSHDFGLFVTCFTCLVSYHDGLQGNITMRLPRRRSYVHLNSNRSGFNNVRGNDPFFVQDPTQTVQRCEGKESKRSSLNKIKFTILVVQAHVA
jgi:hypothetical protein